MNHFLFCKKCDREFDRIVKRSANRFVCWCSECEHTFIITEHTFVISICDCGSDPIQILFEELMEVKE